MAYLHLYLQDAIHYEITKKQIDLAVVEGTASGVRDYSEGDENLVVSLTTHGRRIYCVYQAIESIFQQSLKAHHVVLYLSELEFKNQILPESLKRQQLRGLEIKFEKDIGPYTKLIPALNDFPDAVIVTVDDDYMYPIDMIDRLNSCHLQHPEAVCCCHSRRLDFSKRKEKLYSTSTICYPEKDMLSDLLLAEGFGGVLYPPHSLHPDVSREDLFTELSPFADDLWFKAMALKQGTPVLQMARGKEWIHSLANEYSVQSMGLHKVNVDKKQNDIYLKRIFDYYDLFSVFSHN